MIEFVLSSSYFILFYFISFIPVAWKLFGIVSVLVLVNYNNTAWNCIIHKRCKQYCFRLNQREAA